MQLRLIGFFLLGLAASGIACSSPGRQAAWETEAENRRAQTGTSSAAQATLASQGDEQWKKRDVKASVEQAIASWERVITEDPSNAEAMVKLSRANYFLADGHVSLEDGEHEEELLKLYEKGVNVAEKALLMLEPEFEKSMRGGADMKDAAKTISGKGVGAAYWYCTNLGRFSLLKGLSARLFYKDRVKAMMDRIHEIDPKYFYFGPDRYYGVFYSALPSIAGKDLDKSKQHFELAVAGAPEYLSTRVLKAQYLAVELDDRAMYESILKEVLAASDGDNPDYLPENKAAKRRATKLLSQINEKF
jgi:prepilin-type processing-associated H-X9-DG protein